MQSLKQRALMLQCQEHKDPIRFLNLGLNCPQARRALCADCELEGKFYNFDKVQLIVQSLEQLYRNSEDQLYKKKDAQFQALAKNAREILDETELRTKQLIDTLRHNLERVETKFNEKINSIKERDFPLQFIQTIFQKDSITLSEIQEVGTILSEHYQDEQVKIKELEVSPKVIQNLDSYITQIQKVVELVNKHYTYDTINVQKLQRHSDCVFSISMNQQGNQLISASKGKINNLILWELNRNQEWICKEIFRGHSDSVFWVQFSKYSSSFISSSKDKTISIWKQNKIGVYHQSQILERHKDAVVNFQLNRQENQIASCSWDKTIMIWEKHENEWRHKSILSQHKKQVLSVAFNYTSTLLASAGQDSNIILWSKFNSDEWNLKQIILGHSDTVTRVCFSLNDTLYSSSSDKSIRIWELKGDKYQESEQINGHNDKVNWVFSNGQIMVSSSQDKSMKIWNRQMNNWIVNQTIIQDFSPFSIEINRDLLISRSFKDVLIYKIIK